MKQAFNIVENALYAKYPQEMCEKSVTDLLYGVVLIICKAKKPTKEIKAHIKLYTDKYPDWNKCKIIKSLSRAKRAFLFAVRRKWFLSLSF